MAEQKEAVCKICRNEGEKLFLKGEKCMSDKCLVEKRPYPPGEHGRKRRKESEYSLQLKEKQKTKRIYGVREKQFRNYYSLANKKKGITGENLLQILESRLDNVIYHMGFALSRAEARQLVGHGHFEVNGRKVDIPSYRVRLGDVVKVREKSKDLNRIKECVESSTKPEIPAWLEVDYKKLTGKIKDLPSREQIDTSVQEQLIVELYSK